MSRNKNRNQDVSKAGTRLNHSAYTIESGHGGLKRNMMGVASNFMDDINDRDPSQPRGPRGTGEEFPRRMDPMTRASRELMGREPRAFYGESTGRWHNNSKRSNPPNPQPDVQKDAQGKINRRTRNSIMGRGNR